MSKPVTVTWKSDGEEFTENCFLLSENDEVCTMDGQKLPVMGSLMNSGRVLFEDDQGIFGLNPDEIIKIEELV